MNKNDEAKSRLTRRDVLRLLAPFTPGIIGVVLLTIGGIVRNTPLMYVGAGCILACLMTSVVMDYFMWRGEPR